MEENKLAQVDKEYVIQHFGTDPSFLIEDICEDFKDALSATISDLKSMVKKKQSGKFDESELDRKMGILENNYIAYFDKKCESLDKGLKSHIFQIPRNVLLKEDLPWENLTQSEATDRCTQMLSDMEKQRESYKTLLYRKAYLRNYIDKMKQACIYQEELIQKEANLKEKNCVQDTVETLKFLENQWDSSTTQLNQLKRLRQEVDKSASKLVDGGRTTDRPDRGSRRQDFEFPTEKRLKLEEKLNQEERLLRRS